MSGVGSWALCRRQASVLAAQPLEVGKHRGDKIPVKAPSGKNSGYLAEFCYWNKDGTAKKEPTPVLLNRYKGKPDPTFCPDCGRLVTAFNPPPRPGVKPPPTEDEMKARKPAPGKEDENAGG